MTKKCTFEENGVIKRRCNLCKKTLNIDCFKHDRTNRYFKGYTCKECVNKDLAKLKAKLCENNEFYLKLDEENLKKITKDCTKCKRNLSLIEFCIDRGQPYARNLRCRSCQSIQSGEQRRKNPTYQKERANRLLKIGICSSCGKNPKLKEDNFCETCYFKKKSNKHLGSSKHWEILRKKFYDQKELCYFSGEKLILGVNASIDHKLSKYNHPELKFSVENIAWVGYEINKMKDKRDEIEFIELIKKILKNREKHDNNL